MEIQQAVRGFLTGYFSTCKRSSKTEAAYKIDLNQFASFVGKLEQLQEVTAESLERWSLSLRSTGYAAASIRRKFATVRVFFGYWLRKKILESSPLSNIRLDLARDRVLPRCLTSSDARRIIERAWYELNMGARPESAPSARRLACVRNLAMLELLFATGVRVGELVNLSISDWKSDESAFVVKGKGSRQRLAFLTDDRSRGAIERYLQERRALHLEHDALFANVSGTRISTQGVAKTIARIAKNAGIETRVTPHVLRHTVATLLLRYGADIRIVQEVLGHASIVTTQRYTHVSKEHLVEVLTCRHPNRHIGIQVRTKLLSA